jgi:hypothetical protein
MSTLDFDTPATVPPFVLQDTNPSITVLDPDGNPNHVVEASDGFTVALSWELKGILAPLIVNTWHARLYAQPLGTGGFAGLLNDTTAITATLVSPDTIRYTAKLPVTPAQTNTMHDPQGDGVYQIVVVVSHVNVVHQRDTMAGFSQTIVIDVRKP